MNNKKILGIVAVVVVAVAGIAISAKKAPDQIPSNSNKVAVAASFYPLYFFSQEIGGEKAEVTNITPAGAEPHEYEPTAQDIVTIQNSQLLVLNGAGLEPWAENVKPRNGSVVIVGEVLADQRIEEEGEQVLDPHVWLSPALAGRMADNITKGIVEADPGNSDYYEARSVALKVKLDDLDKEFKAGLKSCSKDTIVTSHAAFGYLASAYGLSQVSVTGVSPEEEPSAKQLAEVADFARKNDVKYIFFESLVSPKLSETIAREVGAQTLVLNPLEGLSNDELAEGKDYFTEMRSNLVNLRIALECQ